MTGETETGREVRVMVDSRALLTIIGSVMDYEESALGSRFVFESERWGFFLSWLLRRMV